MATPSTCSRQNPYGYAIQSAITQPELPNPAEHPEYLEMELRPGVTAQIVWVTPSIASEWLAMLHAKQRKIKKAHLDSLVADHNAGRFHFNGESVIFDWDGFMVDGQHRCRMVVMTGKAAEMLVVRGVPPEVYATIDDSARRSGGDALASLGLRDATVFAAALVMLRRYEAGGLGRRSFFTSPIAVTDLADKHPGMADGVVWASTMKRVVRSRTAVAFCHYVFARIDKSKADEFFAKLRDGAELAADSPVLALRNRVHGQAFLADDLAFYIFKAWNYWRKGQPLRLLRHSEGEAFPTPI